MIKAIRVINYLGEDLELNLRNPHATGLAVRGVEGLTPVKANVNTTDMATGDGGVFNSSRADTRNIVVYLVFLEQPTIEDVRRKTYKYFPLKKELTFEVIMRSGEVRVIKGYVESNEAVVFSKKTGSQISIVCPDPYFKSSGSAVEQLRGVVSEFSFPFSNESLTEDLITFGSIDENKDVSIQYEGSGEPGVVIEMVMSSDVKTPMVYNATTREIIKINTDNLDSSIGTKFIDNDKVVVNTKRGEKSVTLIRGGDSINIMNTLTEDSSWVKLIKGVNVFSYSAELGEGYMVTKIKYRELYEGV